MATKAQIEAKADSVIAEIDATQEPIEQFKKVWVDIVKPTLELISSFTGARADEQINKLIYAADQVCAGNNPDMKNYCEVWNNFHLKSLLKFVQTFTGAKTDRAINKFIEISDSFCPH
jgi:hypothetical protein